MEKDNLSSNPADAVITTSPKSAKEKVGSDSFDVVTIDDINNIKDQATKDLAYTRGHQTRR